MDETVTIGYTEFIFLITHPLLFQAYLNSIFPK